MGYRNDNNPSRFDPVDDAVRETAKEKATGCVIASRPGRRRLFDLSGGYVEFVRESDGSRQTALGIPPRRFFGFFEPSRNSSRVTASSSENPPA